MSGKVMKYLFGGISWGCVVSCIVNVIGTMVKGNAWFTEAGHSYAAQVAAAVIVGVAWVLPSVIYQSDRMPRDMQRIKRKGDRGEHTLSGDDRDRVFCACGGKNAVFRNETGACGGGRLCGAAKRAGCHCTGSVK